MREVSKCHIIHANYVCLSVLAWARMTSTLRTSLIGPIFEFDLKVDTRSAYTKFGVPAPNTS